MSRFLKRVIILKDKNESSAILKIETTTNGYVLTLRCDEKYCCDDYKLGVFGGEDFCLLPLKNSVYCNLDLSGVVATGIFCGDELIFYGSSSPYVEKSFFLEKKRDYDGFKQEYFTSRDKTQYDDEQIATENYYDNRLIDEDLTKNEKQFNNDADAEKENNRSKKESERAEKIREHETRDSFFKSEGSFYEKCAKQKLSDLFSVCEKVTSLRNVLPNSKFVKVNYTSSQSYIVGIIEENGEPTYICYGVDGVYGYPPNSLKEFCHFIPKSLFNLQGDGYYVIFQNALTGETVTPKINIFGI